ncbi:MAG: hypothetical protein U1C19_08390 [Methanobacteriaceae archaeon]|nr:hypothetical protein [Methanobacteriaceae archaeon]
MKLKIICFLIVLLGMISTVSAHGVHVTNESTIVIADSSTGVMAKKLANEMGQNVSVYEFKSAESVNHQLEHALSDSNIRILAVAYQETVTEFLTKNPDLSNRIFISSAEEIDIKNGLNLLNSSISDESSTSSNNNGFLTLFITGLFIGLIVGIAGGAFWMKKKTL